MANDALVSRARDLQYEGKLADLRKAGFGREANLIDDLCNAASRPSETPLPSIGLIPAPQGASNEAPPQPDSLLAELLACLKEVAAEIEALSEMDGLGGWDSPEEEEHRINNELVAIRSRRAIAISNAEKIHLGDRKEADTSTSNVDLSLCGDAPSLGEEGR